MTKSNTPKPRESGLLLNPRRSAHSTIRGYLYQTCLCVLRWLDLQPDEILLCEGDEDLDRFLLGRSATSEQVKAYKGGLSLSDRVVRESLGNFLRSYVALRRRGESRTFVFTTTASKRYARGLGFDLLGAWQAGARTKKILLAVRSLLKPGKKDKLQQESNDALNWLDKQPAGWQGFLDAVKWSFDAPDLDAINRQIKNRLARREESKLLPAESLLQRLVVHVLHTSIQPEPENRTLTGQALSKLIETARGDLRDWARTPGAERIRTLFDELKEIHRLLHNNTATLPPNAPPGKLLTASYEVIAFDEKGRGDELSLLKDWCEDEERRSVLLLTGEGGAGKTRLLIEWCRHLRHQGWHAGFLRRYRKAEELDGLLEGVGPRLVVIDYAEARLAVLEPLLLRTALATEGEGPRLRIVLLARRQADWWTNLGQIGREVEDLLMRSSKIHTVRPLLPKDSLAREKAFIAAIEGFSLELGKKAPSPLHVPDLSRGEFDRVLYLHAAALASLEGRHIETAEDALQQTLSHERQFWHYQIEGLGLDRSLAALMGKAMEPSVTALTLVGGAKSPQHAKALLERVLIGLPLQPHHLDTTLELLQSLYGEEGRGIEALQPDLLGEQLVLEALTHDGNLLARVLDDGTSEDMESTLRVLTRLAQRRPEFSGWLRTALHGRLGVLAEIAFDVAVEIGDPLGFELAAELEDTSDIAILIRIRELSESRRFFASIPLREVGKIATEREWQYLRKQGLKLDKFEKIKYAILSNNLGNRLHESGKLEEALNVTEEAVEVCRQFSEPRALALCLHNLGTRLSGLGRYEDALKPTKEAVEVYRNLAQSFPDVLPVLAASLSNLSARLADLGQQEEALAVSEESVALGRNLVQQKPETRLSLAKSLGNLGSVLGRLDRYEEAVKALEESADILRNLSAQRPDAFLLDFAISLASLGSALRSLGQLEKGLSHIEEAVMVTRKLAKLRPNSFLPDLASQLDTLGNLLGELGHYEKASKITEEAVEINRKCVQLNPGAFLKNLATSLCNMGIRLGDLGESEAALSAFREAIDIDRKLVRQWPQGFTPKLINSLNNMVGALQQLERYEEALLVADEALQILRGFAQSKHEELLPKLAGALNNRGAMLFKVGRHEAALRDAEEAIKLYRMLAKGRPKALLPKLAAALNNAGRMLGEIGQPERAFDTSEESVRILSSFFLSLPLAFQGQMATVTKTYLERARAIGKLPDVDLLGPIMAMFDELLMR